MRVVAYYRVSTQRQGASGLGLEAQRATVTAFLRDVEPVAEFTEVESGRKTDGERPDLTPDIQSADGILMKGYSALFCHPPAMSVAEMEAWEKDLVDPRSEQSRRRRWAMAALLESEDALRAAVQYPDGKKMLEDWMDVASEHQLAMVEACGLAYRAHQRLQALYDEVFLAPVFKRKYKPEPKFDANNRPIPEPEPEKKPRRRKAKV